MSCMAGKWRCINWCSNSDRLFGVLERSLVFSCIYCRFYSSHIGKFLHRAGQDFVVTAIAENSTDDEEHTAFGIPGSMAHLGNCRAFYVRHQSSSTTDFLR